MRNHESGVVDGRRSMWGMGGVAVAAPFGAKRGRELSTIAYQTREDSSVGTLRYPSGTGGWQLGDLDLN